MVSRFFRKITRQHVAFGLVAILAWLGAALGGGWGTLIGAALGTVLAGVLLLVLKVARVQ